MIKQVKHIMLDVDGTLIESFEFDEQCFTDAVKQITGLSIESDWDSYPNVTDRGLLMTFIERQAPHYKLAELEPLVKQQFISNITDHLKSNPAREVRGARAFVRHLLSSNRFVVSIATGGWGETAKLKLGSAGFDIRGIRLISSNHHHQRTKIMKLAIDTTGNVNNLTYFGDAQWDVDACEELSMNLVIVGDRVPHSQRIENFLSINSALRYT